MYKMVGENKNSLKIVNFSTKCLNFRQKKIENKKSAISPLVYLPNFKAIGLSVMEKNSNTQTDRNIDRYT